MGIRYEGGAGNRDIQDKKRMYVNRQEIILDDLDFGWNKDEVQTVLSWWRKNKTPEQIALIVNRHVDEVKLLLFHLTRKRKTKKKVDILKKSSTGC